jgi:DNA-binding LytR/AlgR family response regulator
MMTTTLDHPSTALNIFEKFEVGVIHLDAQRNVLAMNDFARSCLPVKEKQPFDKMVLSFHTERAKPKVAHMLDAAEGCPVASSAPITMIINVPEQVLLIKVTRLNNHAGALTGFVLVFYEVTKVVSSTKALAKDAPQVNRELMKIPTLVNQKIAFLDTHEILFLESQAHYTRVKGKSGFHFCNLSIGDLALRLNAVQFHRIHRCFIVNLKAVSALEREGSKVWLRLKGQEADRLPVARTALAGLKSALGL